MITLNPNLLAQLAQQHQRGDITHRQFALGAIELARREHPFLAAAPPAEILAALDGLPNRVRVALDAIDPLELARQLVAWPAELAGETAFAITPSLALLAWNDTSSGPTVRYSGRLTGIGGRLVVNYTGPWSTLSLGALLAIACDSAAKLEVYEAMHGAPVRHGTPQ